MDIKQSSSSENLLSRFSGSLFSKCGKADFKIIVKANSSDNEILGYDKNRKAYKVNIKAKAENNKANIEIIKFFSRLFKKKIKIVKGMKSKGKVIRVL